MQATHGTENDGTPISGGKWWSRTSSHNHRNELVCGTTNTNDCRVAMFLHSSLDNVKGTLTFQQIGSEAIKAMDYFITGAYSSSDTSRMGLISQGPTSIWDNKVYGATLPIGDVAMYDNVVVHCPGFPCTPDKHLHRVETKVNTNQNSAFPPFQLTESCDSLGNPIQRDIEKTFKHEFFHTLGFTHDGSSNSVVSISGYVCGTGNVFTAHDKSAINAKYP